MWLNSRALEEAGIDPDRKMDNGVNVKFENGELSGLLLEPAACEPAQKNIWNFRRKRCLRSTGISRMFWLTTELPRQVKCLPMITPKKP